MGRSASTNSVESWAAPTSTPRWLLKYSKLLLATEKMRRKEEVNIYQASLLPATNLAVKYEPKPTKFDPLHLNSKLELFFELGCIVYKQSLVSVWVSGCLTKTIWFDPF